MADENTQVLEQDKVDNNVSPNTDTQVGGGGETTITTDADQSASTAQAQQEADAPDVLTKVREIAGWEVDDDYLKKDYRSLAKSEKERAEKLAAIFGEEPDDVLKALLDFKKQGGSYEQFFEAQMLNPDKMSEGELLRRLYEKNNPTIAGDSDLVEYNLRKLYGEGTDLEELKTENPDLYFEIMTQRKLALADAKKMVSDFKVNLQTPPKQESRQSFDDFQKQEEAKLQTNLDNTRKEVEAFSKSFENVDIELEDGHKISMPVNKESLATITSNILVKDEDGIIALQDISPARIARALYVEENMQSFLNEAYKTAKAKVEVQTDAEYNNRQTDASSKDRSASDEDSQRRSDIRSQIRGQL